MKGVQLDHNNLLVIRVIIANVDADKVLVDQESSADILFYNDFKQM